jgi:hypothetical protein
MRKAAKRQRRYRTHRREQGRILPAKDRLSGFAVVEAAVEDDSDHHDDRPGGPAVEDDSDRHDDRLGGPASQARSRW